MRTRLSLGCTTRCICSPRPHLVLRALILEVAPSLCLAVNQPSRAVLMHPGHLSPTETLCGESSRNRNKGQEKETPSRVQAGLEAVGRGACGDGQGGSGCVSLLVSLTRPSPGAPAHGLARRAVRVFRPGLSWFSLRALELKPGPGGGQACADRGTGGVGVCVVAHLDSGSG